MNHEYVITYYFTSGSTMSKTARFISAPDISKEEAITEFYNFLSEFSMRTGKPTNNLVISSIDRVEYEY